MTATLGIGKKSTEAQNQILQLCSNLNAVDGIVTVQDPENVKELYQCISLPDEGNLINISKITDLRKKIRLTIIKAKNI